MKVYKFKDLTDGNHCFILSKNQGEATKALQEKTSIAFRFVESKKIEDLKTPLIILNNILPF